MKNKKTFLLLGTLISSVGLTATSVFLLGNNPTFVVNSEQNIENATLTFDANNRSVETQNGNIIRTSVSGSMKYNSNYLCSITSTNSNGYFYISDPFQSISKIQITWSAKNTYEMYFKVGTTSGSSNVYSSGNLVSILKSYSESTTTINIPNTSKVNYFSISASGFDSTSSYYFRRVVVTYSCNQQI